MATSGLAIGPLDLLQPPIPGVRGRVTMPNLLKGLKERPGFRGYFKPAVTAVTSARITPQGGDPIARPRT